MCVSVCVRVCARTHVTYDFTRRDVQMVRTLRATEIDVCIVCSQVREGRAY